MSAGLFSKALKGAGFSVTTSRDGARSFRSEHDDRTSSPPRGGGKYTRGSRRGARDNWRGSSRGRRGNRSRGRSRGRGRYDKWYSSGGSQSEENDYGGDDDGDIDMEFGSERLQNRYTPYSRPSHKQSGGKFNNSRTGGGTHPGETWSKITIPSGRKHDKEWLLNRLDKICEVPFQPVEFHLSQDNACFFVNDQRAADALRSLSGKITVRDGSRLFVQVRPCPPPKRTGTDEVDAEASIDQDILKKSLDTRYDTATNSLDLSSFYYDKVLNENQIQGVLNRPWLLAIIVKLIKECCPQLQSLNLRSNRINTLEALNDLHEAAPGLSSLNLGENNLKHVQELKKIKNLQDLKSLVVDGNPLCDNYSNSQTGYVNDIWSIFPKLVSLVVNEDDIIRLHSSRPFITDALLYHPKERIAAILAQDNCELPPHIGFDLPSSSNLPEIKGSFIPAELTKKLVPFVKQYFAVYDSDDRQKLLDAYDDEAVFSMCVMEYKKERANTSTLLSAYRKYSRNLKFLHDSDRRLEFLKSSRLSVVAFLNDLPSTKHDLDSLTLDVNFVQQTCMGFTVCGLFKEGNASELRGFTRAFIAVPAKENSIAIINDQLTIRNPTPNQRELASKSTGFGNATASPSLFPVSATPVSSPNLLPTISPQSTISPQAAASPLTTSSPLAGLNAQQQQMVTQFATQSGMNFEWSFKALSENNWDYQKAAEVFKNLHTQGKIPKEAFTK